jgi:cytochrome c-type biogenesis protein CcmE
MLGVLALCAVLGAGLLGAAAMRKEAAYYYTPGKLLAENPSAGTALRLGGMVVDKSIVHASDGITISFMATDGAKQVPVRFRGIVPDLFKEGSGMVADGAMDGKGVFVATRILAKHDERYMPPEVARDMMKTGNSISPVPATSPKKPATQT